MNEVKSASSVCPAPFSVYSCAAAVYTLAKRVFCAVYYFFKHLIFGWPEPVIECKEEAPAVTEECVAEKLGEALKMTFKTKVHYSDEENAVVELGTYFFEHLLEKGGECVEFDPETEIYTVKFPAEKVIPVFFSDRTAEKLKGRVVDPTLYRAQVVQFKLGKEKMEILGNSLSASAKIKAGILGKFSVGATIEGISDGDDHPRAATHMLGAIRLNEGTHAVVRSIVNNVICPLFREDLSRTTIKREQGVRTLHQILHSKQP